MFNIAICDDEETLIGELKENLIKYAAETNKEFCFFILSLIHISEPTRPY